MVSADILNELARIVGEDNVSSRDEMLEKYSQDPSPFPAVKARVVARPGSSEEVSKVLALCSNTATPVLPFGSGYSFTGLSNRSGARTIVIDLKRMNKVLEFDEENHYVKAECGIIVGEMSDMIRKKGFYVNTVSVPYYKDTLGGLISGVVGGGLNLYSSSNGLNNRHIFGLKVVLADGTIIETSGKGANVFEGPTHMRETNVPDLTGIFIGDGGSFGVKTEATLAVYPFPPYWKSTAWLLPNLDKLWEALSKLMSFAPLLYDNVHAFSPSLTEVISGGAEGHEGYWSLVSYTHGFTENEIATKKAEEERIAKNAGGVKGTGLLQEFSDGLRNGEALWGPTVQFAETLVRRASMPFFVSKGRFMEVFTRIRDHVERLVEKQKQRGLELSTAYIFRPILHNTVWTNVNVYYYSDNDKPSVLQILKDDYDYALKQGVRFEPHGGYATEVMGPGWSPSLRNLFASVKKTLDPNNILNPGLWALEG